MGRFSAYCDDGKVCAHLADGELEDGSDDEDGGGERADGLWWVENKVCHCEAQFGKCRSREHLLSHCDD